MSEDYLRVAGLSVAYGSSVAVHNLHLSAKQGELIALLGPSGCGKTTALRAIVGLVTPRAGEITIDGRSVTALPPNKRAIGLVFQSYALFPHLSAFENVAFGLRLQKLSEAQIVARTEAELKVVGLAHLAKRRPAEISGGQQQRLALARALVMKPKLLLLDEPLSNLDARLRLEMRTELQRVQRDTGVTMLFVTHDQSEALALADRIVLMNAGQIEQVGTPDELYNQPVSPFAAAFVGFENIFAVANAQLVGPHGRLPLGFASNAAHLAWRPGGVTVGSGTYTGRVEGVAFAGELREYVLSCALGMIKAHAPAEAKPYALGAQVRFDLPQNAAWPFAAKEVT